VAEITPGLAGRPPKELTSGEEQWECPVLECHEKFPRQVWHCIKCRHHWLMDRTECWNCHDDKFGIPSKDNTAKKLGPAPTLISRKKFAKEAGLSERQRKTALRIASIPKEQFEAMVESENPPTGHADGHGCSRGESGSCRRTGSNGRRRSGHVVGCVP
jgi:hypothetical protein